MLGDRRRRLLFITGTRADYGKLKAILSAVDEHPDLDYMVYVTGMHLLRKYGSTWREITKDGFENVFLAFNQDHRNEPNIDRVLANTVLGLSHYVVEEQPDLIVVHGDRVEALAGALVGSLNNILVAHIEGGEVSGTIDELLRHSISKMSHLHFVSNDVARRRLLRMGEEPSRVFVTGSPNIDIMLGGSLPPFSDVAARYDLEFDEFAIFIMHPVAGSTHELFDQTQAVLRALLAADYPLLVIEPNNDPGSKLISEAIASVSPHPRLRVVPSMKFEHYLSALRESRVIVGNSSSGIHEAPVFGVPSINIGDRQLNRVSTESVRNVPLEPEAVLAEVRRQWGVRYPRSEIFGSGTSAAGFVRTVASDSVWTTSVLKQFSDGDDGL
jgi:UDP-N-acetylglucosamine 2-epimerase (hydrolysing)